MNKIWSLIRTTLVGGLIFLVPLILLVLILQKAFSIIKLVVDPVVQLLPVDNLFGLPMHRILGLTLLILICLLAGYMAKTKTARKISTNLEKKILSKFPGYSFYKQMGESMIGIDENDSHQVVFITMDDSKQLAFLMEKMENEISAVFVPDSPNPFSGSLIFINNNRIESTDITPKTAYKILKQMGAGSGQLFKNKLKTPS